MIANNDERILALKKKIEAKREELSKQSDKFVPVTNCSLMFRDKRYNLNALNENGCITLMIELKALQMAQEALKVDYELSGYALTDWLADLKARVNIIKLKAEKVKLRDMEAQLDSLLTEDKKTELEIDKIEDFLNL